MTESNDKYNLNLEAALKYSEKVFDGTNKSLDNLNNRASAFLGFGGILLRFAFELPYCSIFTKCTKILTIICFLASLITNLICLLSEGKGKIIKPRRMMDDDYFELESKDYKATIVDTIIIANEELEEVASYKGLLINLSIIAITAGASLSALSVIVKTFPISNISLC